MARAMKLLSKGDRIGFQQLMEAVSDYISTAIPIEDKQDGFRGEQEFVADVDYEIVIRKKK